MTRALVLCLLVGCQTVATPDSTVSCDVDTSDHPLASTFQAILDEPVAGGIPGIALAVRTPDGVWQGASGYADLEHRVPMTPCHVHPWASIGKTWHAALALRLVQAGVLDLDDRLADHLPPDVIEGLPNAEVVTLRQLMRHASGMADFNDDLGYVTSEFDAIGVAESPTELLDWVRGEPALFPAGEGYHYSDTAYVLLALVLEAVTGDTASAMADEVFAPLGLTHTSLPRAGDPDPVGRVNSYWELTGGRLENVSDLQGEYDVQVIGAGNLRSTPLESLTFLSALADGALLDEERQAELLDWSAPSERDDGFAYGLGIQREWVERNGETEEWVGHFGGDVGGTAVVLAHPGTEGAFAAAVNLGSFLGGPLNELVGDDFLAKLEEASH